MIGMILTTWLMLANIDNDTNMLLRHIEKENALINNGTEKTFFSEHELNLTAQNNHMLHEILANATASNGVLIPKTH